MAQGWLRRLTWLGLGMVVLAGLEGCTYMRHRGADARQMIDLGATVTPKPYFSFHACGMGIVSAGVGRCDGDFYGLGGDRFGKTRHFHRDIGLIAWSYDEIGWGDAVDPEKPETLERFHIGPVGYLNYPERKPPYAFACLHYLHLGYAGLAFNVRWGEMADFLLGWTTFDLCGDDGKKPGEADWPWRKGRPRKKPVWQPKLPY